MLTVKLISVNVNFPSNFPYTMCLLTAHFVKLKSVIFLLCNLEAILSNFIPIKFSGHTVLYASYTILLLNVLMYAPTPCSKHWLQYQYIPYRYGTLGLVTKHGDYNRLFVCWVYCYCSILEIRISTVPHMQHASAFTINLLAIIIILCTITHMYMPHHYGNQNKCIP